MPQCQLVARKLKSHRAPLRPVEVVTKALKDGLNYELDTGKVRKQHRTCHINLLSKWQSRDEIVALVLPESPEMSLPHENHLPSLDNKETWEDVNFRRVNYVTERKG